MQTNYSTLEGLGPRALALGTVARHNIQDASLPCPLAFALSSPALVHGRLQFGPEGGRAQFNHFRLLPILRSSLQLLRGLLRRFKLPQLHLRRRIELPQSGSALHAFDGMLRSVQLRQRHLLQRQLLLKGPGLRKFDPMLRRAHLRQRDLQRRLLPRPRGALRDQHAMLRGPVLL